MRFYDHTGNMRPYRLKALLAIDVPLKPPMRSLWQALHYWYPKRRVDTLHYAWLWWNF